MNTSLKPLLVAAAAIALGTLSACSLMPSASPAPVAHTVRVNGENYVLRQITDSTWTANAQGILTTLPATTASTAGLRQAVENTSGCKVTDSDYSRQGRQFDAQVDCGARLTQ